MKLSKAQRMLGLLGLVLLCTFVVRSCLRNSARKSRYVFINETSHHEHDLALKMSLKLAEKRSGIENAMILLKELPPEKNIQEVAAEEFSKLRIGSTRSGKGILFLYTEKENQFKIEVARDLEGKFTDALCHRLEMAAQTYMLSDIPQDFLSELLITMNLEGASGTVEGNLAPPPWLSPKYLSSGAGVAAKGYTATLQDYQCAVEDLPKGDLDHYTPSTDPKVTIDLYLESLAHGIGNPALPLLTEGSRLFRTFVPRNGEQQVRVSRYYEKATPYQIFEHGNMALAVHQPGFSTLPIVLVTGKDGKWYVDEPKAWSQFHRYEDGTSFWVKYADNPFLKDLQEIHWPTAGETIYRSDLPTPPPLKPGASLLKLVSELDARIKSNPGDLESIQKLAEIFYFEMGWATQALALFERAEAKAPENLTYRWRLVDLYLNASRADKFLEELKYLAEHLPSDTRLKRDFEFYQKEYAKLEGEF